MRDEVIKYLRHVGDDFALDDPDQDTSPECRYLPALRRGQGLR